MQFILLNLVHCLRKLSIGIDCENTSAGSLAAVESFRSSERGNECKNTKVLTLSDHAIEFGTSHQEFK
jgi:hypothetical protein